MKPKIYGVAIFYGTRTYDLLLKSKTAVLQIFCSSHLPLIRPLGKKSGRTFDKHRYLDNQGLLDRWNEYLVLKNACAYIELEVSEQKNFGGDHELFIMEVKKSKTISTDNILMFQDLIDAGIIL